MYVHLLGARQAVWQGIAYIHPNFHRCYATRNDFLSCVDVEFKKSRKKGEGQWKKLFLC